MTDGDALNDALDAVIAETSFSGVVRVDLGDATIVQRAAVLADRAHAIVMTIDTRIGIASGAKAFTALTVMGSSNAGVSRSPPPPGNCSATTCR